MGEKEDIPLEGKRILISSETYKELKKITIDLGFDEKGGFNAKNLGKSVEVLIKSYLDKKKSV